MLKKLKLALFALIAWIAVVPSARANGINLEVLEGYVKRSGYGSGELFLSGLGFEVHVLGGASGPGCRVLALSGRPIVPCNTYYFIGGFTSWILNGIEMPAIGFDAQFNVFGNPMFLSGPTHAVLTQQVSYAGALTGCAGGAAACFSGLPVYGFNLEGMVGQWSIELQLLGESGDYEIVEETYTFHRPVPEPSSLALMAVGLVGTLVSRRRLGGLSTSSRL